MPPTLPVTEPTPHAHTTFAPPRVVSNHLPLATARATSARVDAPASLTPPSRETASFFLPIATTSLTAHLLIIAWFGAGVPVPTSRIVREPATPPPPAIIEEVQLQPEPVQPPEPQARVEESTPVLDAPAPAADLDIPPLREVSAIAAVPSSVPVSFGIAVNGPVRLVSDAANASGATGGRRATEPVSLDAGSSHDLLLQPLAYPPRAKRQRLTGTVSIEFRTNATGEIADVRVRESSGHAVLDQAALENLRSGRWKGRPGFYVKAFEFSLL